MKKHITTYGLAKKTEYDSNESSSSKGQLARNDDDGKHTELHMSLRSTKYRQWETLKVKCHRFSRK